MKTFLLGCGAQKAGTTWVAKNLNNSPEYWNGGIKEWRFWKHIFNENLRMTQISHLRNKLQEGSGVKEEIQWRISALNSPKDFLEDINYRFIEQGDLKVIGDMTPLNGTLSISELTEIKNHFNKRGVVVKPILIMRDPFERIWSGVRMKVKNKGYDNNTIYKDLLKTYRLETVEKRTRYENIIYNLESVFPKHDIHYEFMEQLFSQKGLNEITSHLSISQISVDIESPNTSMRVHSVPDEIKAEIVLFYKETYVAILEKFSTTSELLWRDSLNFL